MSMRIEKIKRGALDSNGGPSGSGGSFDMSRNRSEAFSRAQAQIIITLAQRIGIGSKFSEDGRPIKHVWLGGEDGQLPIDDQLLGVLEI